VEYEPHTSPSIYVEFPLSPNDNGLLGSREPALAGRTVSVLIWTTTPWTLPSNLAVAFHPEYEYGAYEIEGRESGGAAPVVILATALAETVATVTKHPLGRRIATFPGAVLEGVTFAHPFYDRNSLGVVGDYVTLDQGTG